jgi:uncharacterized protein (TIRG00374 family)
MLKVRSMIREKPHSTKKYIFVLAAGLLVYALFLYFFVDVEAIIAAIRRADPLYYSLAFASAVASAFFHALTWWCLLGALSIKASFNKIFSFIWVGNFVDILIPAESISGEITRAYLMSHDSGENMGKITASIMSHRLIYTATSLVCFVVGSTLFTLKHELTQPLLWVIVIVMVGAAASLTFMFLLCLKKELAWKIVDSLLGLFDLILRGRWHLTDLKPKFRGAVEAFYEGTKTLGERPLSLAWPIALSAAAWVFKLLITLLVLTSLNVEVPLSAIVVVFSLIDTLHTIPLGIPGEVGVIEMAMTGLYTALGIHPVVSATATILTRGVTMWFNLFVGGMVAQWVGFKISMATLLDHETNNR